MFAEFGAKDALPPLTKIVIAVSKAFVTLPPADRRRRGRRGRRRRPTSTARRRGKRMVHRLILRLPIIGPVMQKIAVARFTRTLGTLLGLGRADPRRARDRREDGRQRRRGGGPHVRPRSKISEGQEHGRAARRDAASSPAWSCRWSRVGEQTGALDTMLSKIADFYEEEVDVAVAALTVAARADPDGRSSAAWSASCSSRCTCRSSISPARSRRSDVARGTSPGEPGGRGRGAARSRRGRAVARRPRLDAGDAAPGSGAPGGAEAPLESRLTWLIALRLLAVLTVFLVVTAACVPRRPHPWSFSSNVALVTVATAYGVSGIYAVFLRMNRASG